LEVPLCRLHPEEEVTAPGSFNIKDFFRSILLGLILLGEAEWSKALDLKKVKEFVQEMNDSGVP